jgi:hypothetical protein
MAKEKLISITFLKNALQDLSQAELISLITETAQSCPQAKEFLTVKFAAKENINEILQKYKDKVEHEFFPKRGLGKLNLREARKAISNFKKICHEKTMIIDIMLFYVENCVRFTEEYGDINESFYTSAENVYEQVVKEINQGDEPLYNQFADRLKAAAEDACDGWGFNDDMMDLYLQIDWINHDEV